MLDTVPILAPDYDDLTIDPTEVIATITSDGKIHVRSCHERTHDLWVSVMRNDGGQSVAAVIATPLPADAVGQIHIIPSGHLTSLLKRGCKRR